VHKTTKKRLLLLHLFCLTLQPIHKHYTLWQDWGNEGLLQSITVVTLETNITILACNQNHSVKGAYE
jgi:hypothetical protein